jgi:hypothetical protein
MTADIHTATVDTQRPYPNVRQSKFKAGRWEARGPRGPRGRYLGTFDTPEAARHAALIAQAEHLEAKAAHYRAEAAALRTAEDAR